MWTLWQGIGQSLSSLGFEPERRRGGLSPQLPKEKKEKEKEVYKNDK